MHKEGLETYNDLINTFNLLLLTSITIRELKQQLLEYNWYKYILCHHAVITTCMTKYLLLRATVLTNKLVILTIYFFSILMYID